MEYNNELFVKAENIISLYDAKHTDFLNKFC